jgi:hypothetical protein
VAAFAIAATQTSVQSKDATIALNSRLPTGRDAVLWRGIT